MNKDPNELKSYKKDLNELKNHIADYQAFTKDAVKSVFDKLSEMEDFKRKTAIHQVAIKKEMGLLQDDVEAMKAKLSETFVFLDTISTKLDKLSATQASGNSNKNNNDSSSNNDRSSNCSSSNDSSSTNNSSTATRNSYLFRRFLDRYLFSCK